MYRRYYWMCENIELFDLNKLIRDRNIKEAKPQKLQKKAAINRRRFWFIWILVFVCHI